MRENANKLDVMMILVFDFIEQARAGRFPPPCNSGAHAARSPRRARAAAYAPSIDASHALTRRADMPG